MSHQLILGGNIICMVFVPFKCHFSIEINTDKVERSIFVVLIIYSREFLVFKVMSQFNTPDICVLIQKCSCQAIRLSLTFFREIPAS